MIIVDAHLDLADNVLSGRPVDLAAGEQPSRENETPTVGLPDLRKGNVRLIGATIFCMPSLDGKPGYHNSEEAYAIAEQQLTWYRAQEEIGNIQFIFSRQRLDELSHPLSAVMILEGADAIRTPVDLNYFHEQGVRIIGLAWKRTRYAGGTGAPGPLTPDGVALVREIDKLKIIHDVSHLAEESFWQLLEMSSGPVMASHSNCRAIVPTDRQLADSMIRAIADRDGVIGINFYDKFLLPPDQLGKRRATLDDVISHIRHMCDLLGSARSIGIGTDMDGGFGRENIPIEIETSADLGKLAGALKSSGFDDADTRCIMGENWLRFFRKNL